MDFGRSYDVWGRLKILWQAIGMFPLGTSLGFIRGALRKPLELAQIEARKFQNISYFLPELAKKVTFRHVFNAKTTVMFPRSPRFVWYLKVSVHNKDCGRAKRNYPRNRWVVERSLDRTFQLYCDFLAPWPWPKNRSVDHLRSRSVQDT